MSLDTQEYHLPLVVVKTPGEAPSLFERSWLQVIKLDWPKIFSQGTYAVRIDAIKELQGKYADIFKQELAR